MKATYRTTAAILTAAVLIGAAGCTKKTAVDGTSDPSASDSAQSPIESMASGMPTDVSDPIPETEFDIHDYTFDTVYGTQLPEYVDRQYYFDGEEVPIAESNFYLINAFMELCEYAAYGYYPMDEDGFLDLSADIDYGDEEAGDFKTYGELFTVYAERMLASTCTICKLAHDEGLELSQETLDAIDGMIEKLDTETAQPNGVSLDEYLQLYYGESCNEEAFRQVMINYYLADLYTTQFIDNYEPTEEQLADYTYPVIRYALFSAPLATATEDDLTRARGYAEALVEEAAGNIDDFYNLGQAAFEAGTCAQCSEITVPIGRTVSAFEDWAWDEARTDGELGVIYAEEFGYFAVGYVGTELDTEAASEIGVEALGDFVSSLVNTDGYLLSTDPNAVAEPAETEVEGDASENGEPGSDETAAETEAETEAAEESAA